MTTPGIEPTAAPSTSDPTHVLVMAVRPIAYGAREGRAFVVRELTPFATSGEPAEDFLDAAATITSELVTNAINAGARLVSLALDLYGRHVLISVTDDADGVVAVPPQDLLALHGRGLRIIAVLSRAWGVAPDPRGKRVWAELDFPSPTSQQLSADPTAP